MKKGDKKDLNELKQELDIDDHKVAIEELYHRLGTNPETVSRVRRSMSERRARPPTDAGARLSPPPPFVTAR